MRRTNIGGSALIEGVLMLGPENAAIAIRKPDGNIHVERRALPPRKPVARIPVIRGVYNFFRQIVITMKALMYSAEFMELEEGEGEPSRFELFLERLLGDRLKDVLIYLAVLISIAFSVGVFVLLPNLAADLLSFDTGTRMGVFLSNLFEGLIRIGLFFFYMVMVSRLKDIRRVWQYHGAEHKVINCYEHGDGLTVEKARKYTTKHPRCGTSFMFLVMVVSILVFSLLPWGTLIGNILLRLAMVPLVAGLSYEIIRFAGKHEGRLARVISYPGLVFQLFTTLEPDDRQIEVALEAFKNALPGEKDSRNS